MYQYHACAPRQYGASVRTPTVSLYFPATMSASSVGTNTTDMQIIHFFIGWYYWFWQFDSFDTSNLTLRLVKCLKKQKHTLIQILNVRVSTSNTLAGLSAPAAAAAEEEEEAGRSGGRSAAARFNELHLTYCCVLHRHACTTRLLLARVHRELKLSFLHHHAL